MSRNIVAKFGGTSVKTASAIRQVAEIVRKNPDIRLVVVSAVGGITNLLVKLCSSIEDKSLIQNLLDIHITLAKELGLDLKDKITSTIASTLFIERNASTPSSSSLLDPRFRGDDGNGVGTLTIEAIDRILSLGEDLSSLIVHSYLVLQGINTTWLNVRDYIITDDNFGKGVPDLNAILDRAKNLPDGLCITQGFIGSTADGRTTTLGRGGSDYSAALLAEAIKAERLLIYTDVPGVYTLDPNLVSDAQLIPELSFQEMAEMANFGAKILHPATLEPCIRAKIPVRILSTFEPNKSGTYINVIEHKTITPKVRAVTLRKGQVLVTIKSLKMLNAYGFLANIFSILAKHKVSIDIITTSEVSVALTIDGTNSGSYNRNPFITNRELLNELKQFAEVALEENLTLLAVVGSGFTMTGIIQRTLGILESYRVRLICYGASSSSISVLVNEEDAMAMAKLLHSKLLVDVNV